MSLSKYKFRLPLLQPEELRQVDMENALQEIKHSKNCLVIIQPYRTPAELMITGLNEDLLSSCVVLMNAHDELYQFLKWLYLPRNNWKKILKKERLTLTRW